MKLNIITLALVAITVAPSTAEAAWQVKTKHDYKNDETEVSLLQTQTEVLQEGVGIPVTQNYMLEIDGICYDKNSWQTRINAEYINLTEDAWPSSDDRYQGARAPGWSRFDNASAREMLVSDRHAGKNFMVLVDHEQLDFDGDQLAFAKKMETSQKLTLGIPYYGGEVVLRFDLIGFNAALAKAKAICSGK
ncbi:MAG: hypothetical protein OXU88_08400 [Gammaproteobacteria bacterium]|nr:hypothetical protein [Gammaproteobacteria bacterium]